MTPQEITQEVNEKERISQLYFMAYANRKKNSGVDIIYRNTKPGSYADFYAYSGDSWSLIEAKDRLGANIAWFLKNGNGPYLQKDKFDHLMEYRDLVFKMKGHLPNLYYFNFAKNAVAIYKIDPTGQYKWYQKELQKNDSEKSSKKVKKWVTELYHPIEIMYYKQSK